MNVFKIVCFLIGVALIVSSIYMQNGLASLEIINDFQVINVGVLTNRSLIFFFSGLFFVWFAIMMDLLQKEFKKLNG